MYFLAASESAYKRVVRRKTPEAEINAKNATSEKSGLEPRKKTTRVERERKRVENRAESTICFLLPNV